MYTSAHASAVSFCLQYCARLRNDVFQREIMLPNFSRACFIVCDSEFYIVQLVAGLPAYKQLMDNKASTIRAYRIPAPVEQFHIRCDSCRNSGWARLFLTRFYQDQGAHLPQPLQHSFILYVVRLLFRATYESRMLL